MQARIPVNGTPRWSTNLASSRVRWRKKNPFAPRGSRERSPLAPGSCGAAEQWGRASDRRRNPPYRTAESEGARYPFQKDINRKRCLTSSKTSSLPFFFFFNWILFFLFSFSGKTRLIHKNALQLPGQTISRAVKTIAASWCQTSLQ